MDTIAPYCALCGELALALEIPTRRPVCREHLCPGLTCRACTGGSDVTGRPSSSRPCNGRCPMCRSISTPPYVLAQAKPAEPKPSREAIDELLGYTSIGRAVLAARQRDGQGAPAAALAGEAATAAQSPPTHSCDRCVHVQEKLDALDDDHRSEEALACRLQISTGTLRKWRRDHQSQFNAPLPRARLRDRR